MHDAFTGNRMVALCDILGFSDLVTKIPLGDIVDNVVGWLRKSLYHSLYHTEFPEATPTLGALQQHAHVGLVWFSDSIFLYARDDTDESVRALLETLSWVHFETIAAGQPGLRSGVSYGPVHIDPGNSVFVGVPIIEAYCLEGVQEWSGGALTDAAVSRVPPAARTGKLAGWWVVPYRVPLKGPTFADTLAINWSFHIHPLGWRLRWSEASPDIARKFDNTRLFHEALCPDCGPAPNRPMETDGKGRGGSSA